MNEILEPGKWDDAAGSSPGLRDYAPTRPRGRPRHKEQDE